MVSLPASPIYLASLVEFQLFVFCQNKLLEITLLGNFGIFIEFTFKTSSLKKIQIALCWLPLISTKNLALSAPSFNNHEDENMSRWIFSFKSTIGERNVGDLYVFNVICYTERQ